MATSGVVPIADMSTGANFVDVLVRINPTGSFDLVYNGRTIMDKLDVGFQPITGGRFGFGARTGGLNTNQFVDDVSITTSPGNSLLPGSCQVSSESAHHRGLSCLAERRGV